MILNNLILIQSLLILTILFFNQIQFISSFPRTLSLRRLSLQMTSKSIPFQLEKIKFDNRNLQRLPVNNGPKTVSRIVKGSIFAEAELQPVKNPSLVCASPDALQLLGLPYKAQSDYTGTEISNICAYLSGNEKLPGSQPSAHVYCGHQFGSFAGQLGDGAAMYLGEAISTDPDGSEQRWELQLKGSGLTPFSRTAGEQYTRTYTHTYTYAYTYLT